MGEQRKGTSRRELLPLGLGLVLIPKGVLAQSRRRLVALLMGGTDGDPAVPPFVDAIRTGLLAHGWEEGRNYTFMIRFTAGTLELAEAGAAEIVAANPDVILGNTSVNALAILRLTSTIPVVFLPVADPVALGMVDSYGRPGRNATGFTNFEPSHAGKWISYLHQAFPAMRRVALMYNPPTSEQFGQYYQAGFESAAELLGLELVTVVVPTMESIPPAVATLSEIPFTGIVAVPDIFMWNARRVVRDAVREHGIPTIYPFVNYTDDGGLMSYSVDTRDLFRRGGEYLGMILNGADVSTLPVQGPQIFRLVVNLRAAAELGLTIPLDLIAAADQVIE